jgi:hypothetical protein
MKEIQLMKTATRSRVLRLALVAAAIGLLTGPLTAEAQTTVPEILETTGTATSVGDPTSSEEDAPCAGEYLTALKAKLPLTIDLGGNYDFKSTSGTRQYFGGPESVITGLFDDSFTFFKPDDVFYLNFGWDQASGAVTDAELGSLNISVTKTIGGKSVIDLAFYSDDSTGTLTQDAEGVVSGSIKILDFKLRLEFLNIEGGNVVCFVALGEPVLTFGKVTPEPGPTAKGISLTLDFKVGDNIRAGDAGVPVSGSGLLPGADYTVVLRSDPVQIGNGVNDDTGAFSAVYPIPADTPGGSHSVTVSSLDINGDPVTAVAYFSIDDNGTVTAISYDAPTPDPTAVGAEEAVAEKAVALVAVPTFTG